MLGMGNAFNFLHHLRTRISYSGMWFLGSWYQKLFRTKIALWCIPFRAWRSAISWNWNRFRPGLPILHGWEPTRSITCIKRSFVKRHTGEVFNDDLPWKSNHHPPCFRGWFYEAPFFLWRRIVMLSIENRTVVWVL